MKRILLLAIVACCILPGCGESGGEATGPESPSSRILIQNVNGVWLYSGYSEGGDKIITGILSIVMSDSVRISGTWEFYAVDSTATLHVGPQIGSGRLVGTLQGEKLSIGLNPDYVDNNVFLVGTYVRSGLKGSWIYAGFPGVLWRGTFTAERILRHKPD